jgi:hypothetical protein
MPRKKPQAKKSPSVLSVETAYEPTPSEASQRNKPAQNHFPDATAISHVKRHNVAINRNRIAIYYFRSIAIETQSERPLNISTSFQFSGSAIENWKQHQNQQNHSNSAWRQQLKWMKWITGQLTAASTHWALQPDLMKSNGK